VSITWPQLNLRHSTPVRKTSRLGTCINSIRLSGCLPGTATLVIWNNRCELLQFSDEFWMLMVVADSLK
jgi:hypothetical protein